MRTALSATLIALAIALCASCKKAGPPPAGERPIPSGPRAAASGSLTVWDWLSADPSQGVGHWLIDVDKAFEKAHPGVKVNHVAQSHTEYYQILKAAEAAAGEAGGPDVVMIHQGSRVLDHKASLVALDRYLEPELKQAIVGWELTSEGLSAEGKPYAVPVAVQGNAWYYNKEILTKAGVDPEVPPATWDEFLAVCDKVKAIGVAPIACGEKEGDWADWFLNSSSFLELSADEATKLQRGEMAWTDPKVAALFERLEQLGEREFFQKGFLSTPLFPDAGEVFMRGEAAFCLGLLSDVAHWKEFGEILGEGNLGVMPCPGTGTIPVGGGFAYGITSWSQQPDLAFEYIKLIVSDDNANEFLKQAGSFPANQNFDPQLIADPNAKVIAGWLAEKRVAAPLTGKIPTEVVESIKREGQRILSRQTDVPAALKAIEATAERTRTGQAK